MEVVEEHETAPAQEPERNTSRTRVPKIKTLNAISVVVAVILVVAAIVITMRLLDTTNESELIHDHYDQCSASASSLMIASDYLTSQARMYVVTGDRRYMDAYFEELFTTKRRDNAVEVLDSIEGDERATIALSRALDESNALALTEFYAMRLTSDAYGIKPVPEPVANVDLSPEDEQLSNDAKAALAMQMVLGEDYRQMKTAITQDVDACATELVEILEKQVLAIEGRTNRLLFLLTGIVVLLMVLVAFNALSNYYLVTRPLRSHEKNIKKNLSLETTGCEEVRQLAYSYNLLHREVEKRTRHLEREAEIDALTDTYNRGAYDRILEQCDGNIALILVDVDHFKEVNDKFGHEMGDKVLKKVAHTIIEHFRSTDYVCRVGGDEFAVIATKVGPSSQEAISRKLEAIAADLENSDDGLPKTTLSFGIAFDDGGREENLFHAADQALYESKRRGRNTYSFHEAKA